MSAIDPTKPTAVAATTQSVRDNFSAAKSEIEDHETRLGTAETKLSGIEVGATADQSDAEIATAYGNVVGQVSGPEITAGTETALRTYSPANVVALIGAHETGEVNVVDSVNSQTGAVVLDQDDIGDGTTNKAYTATEQSKLAGIETTADVTDATNVDAAGAVMEADFDANTILAADADNTPAALAIAEQTVLGRLTGGNIKDLSIAELATLIGFVSAAQAPAGGSTGQYLSKVDGTDYNYEWATSGAGVTELDGLSDVDTTGAIEDDVLALNGVGVWVPVAQSGAIITSVNTQTGAVVLDQDDIADGTTYGQYALTERSKLAGIAVGADVSPVASVNSQTGIVSLDTGDIADTTDARYMSDAQESKLDAIVAAAAVPAGGTTGQVLEKIDGTDYNTQWATPSGGAVAMDDLTDADTTTAAPSTDDVLTWNGSNWVPVTPSKITFEASRIIGSLSGDSAYQALTYAEVRTAINVEDGATADQSNAEIETAYAAVVGQVSGGEITAGTETALRTYSPADIVSLIAAHESGGGGLANVVEDTTPQLGGDLDGQGNDISNVVLVDYAVESASPSSSSGTLTLDYTTGPDFEVTLTEDITTITLSNLPASGVLGKITLCLIQAAASSYTVAWPAGWLTSDGVPIVMPTGFDEELEVAIWTRDAGTKVKYAEVGQGYAAP